MTTSNLTSAFQVLAVENGVSILVGSIPLTLQGVLGNLDRTLTGDDGELDLSGHERIALRALMDEHPMTYASAFLDAAVVCMKTISKDWGLTSVHRWRAADLCDDYRAARATDKRILNQRAKRARSEFGSASVAIKAGLLPACRTMTPDQAVDYFIQAFGRQRPKS